MGITRSTTPYQTLSFPDGTFDDAIEVWVMYKQKAYTNTFKWYGNSSAENVGDVNITDDVITVGFTQEQTNQFKSSMTAQVMVKWRNDDLKVHSSDPVDFDIEEIFDDALMTYEPPGPEPPEPEGTEGE